MIQRRPNQTLGARDAGNYMAAAAAERRHEVGAPPDVAAGGGTATFLLSPFTTRKQKYAR
jgi:hypothetical protein